MELVLNGSRGARDDGRGGGGNGGGDAASLPWAESIAISATTNSRFHQNKDDDWAVRQQEVTRAARRKNRKSG